MFCFCFFIYNFYPPSKILGLMPVRVVNTFQQALIRFIVIDTAEYQSTVDFIVHCNNVFMSPTIKCQAWLNISDFTITVG